MLFNVDKCTVIHMGRNNLECEYKLGESIIRSSTKERDLGVVIDKTVCSCSLRKDAGAQNL